LKHDAHKNKPQTQDTPEEIVRPAVLARQENGTNIINLFTTVNYI